MQSRRADIFRDQDDLDALFTGEADDFAQHDKIVLVGFVDGNRHELQRIGFGLIEKGEGFGKSKVAPVFAKLGFHIFNQEVEVLYVATDCAGDNRAGFGLF
jgi:hypothetical protein